MDIVICTDQSALVREYQAHCKSFSSLTLRMLSEFGPDLPLPPEETEKLASYVTTTAQRVGLPAVAEESILFVPVMQQRYSTKLPIEEQITTRQTLLKALQAKMPCDRSACLECTLVYCAPGQSPIKFKGSCEGILLDKEQGSGFGFDPLFRKHSYHQTFAQLPSHVKRAVSERTKALEKWMLWLESTCCR